ncbi:cyclic-phosphate processing receiver domain-containing protein [Paenibacillus tengchongensis]|uniref:cyclic-phosphate processing receiver domain-containing protein n=1 Tax=Paenibacillus tengchongensis TaxID=2608684 RepID=UPI00124CBC63|nr:cyclic-phosphate processing receiver domain-containing protein [Paenibacillus tengchongensis]
MINVFMDDLRKAPPGFALARSVEECLLMLRECEIAVLSLDYDMGPGSLSGTEVAARMVLEHLFPREIALHTSSSRGRREMYEILYPAIPRETKLHHGPLSVERLRQLAESCL